MAKVRPPLTSRTPANSKKNAFSWSRVVKYGITLDVVLSLLSTGVMVFFTDVIANMVDYSGAGKVIMMAILSVLVFVVSFFSWGVTIFVVGFIVFVAVAIFGSGSKKAGAESKNHSKA